MSIRQIMKNIYICDYCGKEHEEKLPIDWFSVVVTDGSSKIREQNQININGCCKEHMVMAILSFYRMDSWIDAKLYGSLCRPEEKK